MRLLFSIQAKNFCDTTQANAALEPKHGGRSPLGSVAATAIAFTGPSLLTSRSLTRYSYVSALPQAEQKRAPGGFACWQRGQAKSSGVAASGGTLTVALAGG